ncbi:enoyl-CoA hydratase/isomerase-like protein [Tamilnaduibacter salinus]|uniref:3-hydroxyisobutyryl-CoA hydrolase n=1 Tax=Tamilnaduibacter salinus TaxID=1484056 RepID=A0A2U1CTW8_9GAMM|nr:enoyl-CoA hydratase/isomerase family protein [Tamilnaduibacter salinus]PVY70065.1 enoyl-CoA hydratase/isomerase-like protein [Tamilnaduibacter salinus]
MSDQPIVFEEWKSTGDASIGVARLNAPRSLNSLSLEMIRRLRSQLQHWASDPGIRAVWLEASGDKAFCAGGDIVALYRSMTEARSAIEGERFFTEEYQLDYEIHTFPKPIVCWGNGIVMGGGIGLMVGASHRVVTEHSTLAMPEVSIGLYPDVGAGWFLNRMPGDVGLFLGLTGARINGPDALFAGIADRFIRHDLKPGVIDALVGAEWQRQPAHHVVGSTLRQFECRSTEAMPESAVRTHFDEINRAVDTETVEQAAHQLAELGSRDDWLGRSARGLGGASPTSLALTWRHYHQSRLDSLAQVLDSELVLSCNCLTKGEFAEGVRALLIEKDGQPRWRYPSLASMDSEWIDAFFRQ